MIRNIKRVTVSVLTLIFVFIAICGCGTNKLSGRYEKEGSATFNYLEFFPDGKYISSKTNYEGNYSTDNGRLRLEGVLVDSMVFYYKIEGNTLILSDYEDFRYPDTYKKK